MGVLEFPNGHFIIFDRAVPPLGIDLGRCTATQQQERTRLERQNECVKSFKVFESNHPGLGSLWKSPFRSRIKSRLRWLSVRHSWGVKSCQFHVSYQHIKSLKKSELTMPAGSKSTIHMSKKSWPSWKNTFIFIFNIIHLSSTFQKHRFHKFNLKTAICETWWSPVGCEGPANPPFFVESGKSKTKLGTKNPHTKYWKPYPLSNLCDLCLNVTAVQSLATNYYPLYVQASMLETTIFFYNFPYQGAPGSAAIPTCNVASAEKGNSETWDWSGHGGLWFSRIWHQSFLCKQSFMTQTSTPAMRWPNQRYLFPFRGRLLLSY